MSSRHVITIALSAAGLVGAALIAMLVLGDLGAPSTDPGPQPVLEPAAAPTAGGAAAAPAAPAAAPEPSAAEQLPAPPKLVPPGAEPQPPRPIQPTIWGDSPPSPAVAPSYGAGE